MIANLINQILIYDDSVPSDNPALRVVDWSRKMYQVLFKSAMSQSITLAPSETKTIFDGTRTNPLDITSILSLTPLTSSTYRISVTAGAAGFRTARAVSAIDACVVAINNGVMATFTFTAATVASVVAGDIMRIKGQLLGDAVPYIFNPLNAGLWKVIGVNGVVITAVRPDNECFQGVAESVVTAGTDVQFYSADGIQKGDKMAIDGTFSAITQRTYEVKDVTPTTIDFSSVMPLPAEAGLTYVLGTIAFYISAKRYIYLESNQDATLRFNSDTSDNVKINPIAAGDANLVAVFSKIGDTYKLVIVNKSVNTANVRFVLGE